MCLTHGHFMNDLTSIIFSLSSPVYHDELRMFASDISFLGAHESVHEVSELENDLRCVEKKMGSNLW